MKINFNLFNNTFFKGKREDRNNVNQLKADNTYSLTHNNQRNITNSIENLSKDSSEQNIKFLMNVAKNMQYGTSLDLNKNPNNYWQVMLQNATRAALDENKSEDRAKLEEEFNSVFLAKQPVKAADIELKKLRDKILSSKKLQNEIQNSQIENIRNIPKNLDYFLVSSEIPTKEKKASLEKLAHFMSRDYEITEQLKDRKAEVLGEILNDIIVKTPESDKPNIKQVNQRQHGSCAAISIARKTIAYEDKSNYIQSILNELDSSDAMEVYDISKPRQGQKVKIPKAQIDYDYAKELGYRIIDASVLQWMNAANQTGSKGQVVQQFRAFDKENFDTFHDGHYYRNFEDPDLAVNHEHLRALIKAKEAVETARKSIKKRESKIEEQRLGTKVNSKQLADIKSLINDSLGKIMPNTNSKEFTQIIDSMLKFENDEKGKSYINAREPESTKISKIVDYLTQIDPSIDKEVSKDEIQRLFKNYTSALEINKLLNENHTLHTPQKLARANRQLYDVAGSYRTVVNKSLDVPEILNASLIEYGIADNETRLLENVDKLAQRVLDPSEAELTKEIGKKLGLRSPQSISDAISELKNELSEAYTDSFDNLYSMMLSGSRKDVIAYQVQYLQQEIEAGNNDILEIAASTLNVGDKKEDILGKLSSMAQVLQGEPTEKEYSEIINLLGVKNQTKFLIDTFNSFQTMLASGDPTALNAFLEANEIQDATPEAMMQVVQNMAQEINSIIKYTALAENLVRVKTDDGRILNTNSAKELVVSEMEKDGLLTSEPMLRSLQAKFAEINRSRDIIENAELKGENIRDLQAYKFSPEQQDALNKVQRNLSKIRHYIRAEYVEKNRLMAPHLAEHIRNIGREKGQYWVGQEGSSGLSEREDVRILEQMTNRPYYKESNIEKIAEKIKRGPYSGVSSTNVYHNDHGWHAMYIEDIAPVEVIDPITGEKTIKDAVMHDNTWGAVEHQNTWVDAMGLTRTDYKAGRGGQNGYITDDLWRNGNLVEEFLNMPGVIKQNGDGEDFKYRLMTGAVLPGASASIHSTATSLMEEAFLGPSMDIYKFQTLMQQAMKMSDRELEVAFKRVEKAGDSAEAKIEMLDKEINQKVLNGYTIKSEEDYNKLPKDGLLRFNLRKMALSDTYKSNAVLEELYDAQTNADLDKIEKNIRKIAQEDFKYAFGKTTGVYRYIKNSATPEIILAIESLEKRYGFTIDKKEDAIKDLTKNPPKDFDGKLSSTIDDINDRIYDLLAKNIDDTSILPIVKEELENSVEKILNSKLQLQLADLSNESLAMQLIKKWIDKTYDPATDADFVRIFRSLQELDNAEFDKMIAHISNEDLGIEKINEFDYINKIRNADDDLQTKLEGFVRVSDVHSDLKFSRTEKLYKHEKFEKKHTYDIHPKGVERTFDELYYELNSSMSNLQLDKVVNKNKDEAFRKYGSRPAMPKVNLLKEKNFQTQMSSIRSSFDHMAENVSNLSGLAKVYKATDVLTNLSSKLPESGPVSQDLTIKINKALQEFVDADIKADEFEQLVDVANAAMQVKEADVLSEYIAVIVDEFESSKDEFPLSDIDAQVKEQVQIIEDTKKLYVEANIVSSHQGRVKEAFNDMTRAYLKGSEQDVESAFEKVSALMKKHHILNQPEELLKAYIKVLKQGDKADRSQVAAFDSYLAGAFFASSLVSMEFTLMNAAKKGNEAKIGEELKEFKIPKGAPDAGIKIGTDEGLQALIDTMKSYSGEEFDTLWLFLNQTGLSDRAMELEDKDFDSLEMKNEYLNTAKEIVDLRVITPILSQKINDAFTGIDMNADPKAVLHTVLTETKKESKKLGATKFGYLNMIHKTFKEQFEQTQELNPSFTPVQILAVIINQILPARTEKYQGNLTNVFSRMQKEIESSENFVKGLHLDNDSEMGKLRDEYLARLVEFGEYTHDVAQEVGLFPAT